jgi:hypothetical protein
MSVNTVATILVTLLISMVGSIFTVVMYLIKLTARWTRMEARLEEFGAQLKALVDNKDAVHRDLVSTMDKLVSQLSTRLRYLEEHQWKNQPPPER